MWNFLHCHPVMCLECKVHTKFSVYWKVAALLMQNTVNLLHLKYLLQLRTRVQWSNPPLQIGVIVPVGRFGLLLQSIWCPRCAGIYSYIHPACSSRCNRHFCQENYRFSDGKTETLSHLDATLQECAGSGARLAEFHSNSSSNSCCWRAVCCVSRKMWPWSLWRCLLLYPWQQVSQKNWTAERPLWTGTTDVLFIYL